MLNQNFGALRKYVPAELKHNSRGWYIEYYRLNTTIDEFERVRVMLNRERKRCKSLTEFKLQASAIMLQINNQLAAGYINVQQTLPAYGFGAPDTTNQSGDNIRFYTPLEQVIDLYETDRSKELKETTMRSYSCFCKQFKQWIHKNYPTISSGGFSQILANQYMEFVLDGNNSKGKTSVRKKINEDRVSARTYNNNIKLARALFSWAMEKSYARINPFEHLKQKKAQGKDRTIIPKEVRDRIVAYFRGKNPAFIIVMQLVYKSFLRPVEITRVKVEQLNFEKHCIEMKGSQKKNGKDHNCRMDDKLEALLRDHIRGAKPDDFVFGAGTWKPSQTPAASHSFTIIWDRMREALKLPREYQLYSLRDSGINNLLRAGANDLDVVQIVGHSDLAMTFRYANHIDSDLINRINKIAPEF
ncbi:MAG: tyrosine-type recombinase/integrase [Paludibacteraceae bacterium]|nr:tyrosine-type recombinase/integrase [Paludibacteraceae bacterium]